MTKNNKNPTSYFDKEMACSQNKKLVCPHCFHENSSEYFYEGAREEDEHIVCETECSMCDKPFVASLDKFNQNYGYTTKPIPCDKDKHKFKFERSFNQGKESEGNELRCSKCWESKYQWTKQGKVLSPKNIQREYRRKQKENMAYAGDTPKSGTFHLSNKSIGVETAVAEGNRTLFLSTVDILKNMGFKLVEMTDLAHYPSLKFYRRHGVKNGVKFTGEYYPNGMRFSFFDATGEKYSSTETLNYLQLKLVTLALQKIQKNLFGSGNFVSSRKDVDWHGRPNLDGLSRSKAIQVLKDFPIPTPKESYNRKDKEGQELSSGDIRYAYSFHGELIKGVVKHNINNMWWLITPSNYYNIYSGDLFSSMEGKSIKKRPEAMERLKTELSKAIKEENFERCIVLKKIIQPPTK